MLIPQKGLSQNLEFQGNQHLTNPTRFINSFPATTITDSIIKNWQTNLITEYSRFGFFWTTIKIETTAHKIKFNIQENQPAKIKQINYQGNNNFTEQELNSGIRKSIYFSDSNLKQQINDLINFYENNGFPFVSITAQDFTLNDIEKHISYTLLIEENSKVFINDIYFTNTPVKNSRLKQIYRFRSDELYSKTKIEQKLVNLFAHNIKYNLYHILNIDTSYVLQVELAKMKSSQIISILTYLPNHPQINGYFYFTNHNFFNSLRKVSFALEKYSGFTDFSFQYADPYLFNFITSTGINHTTYDTIYAQTDINLDIKLPVVHSFSTNFRVNYKHLSSGIQSLNSNTTWWLGQGLQLQNMIFTNNIPKGYAVTIIPQIGSRKTNEQNFYLSYTDISTQTALPVSNNIGLSLDIILKNIYCKDELTMADSLRLGGIKNLRGFQENEFATNQYLLLKNEMKYYRTSTTLLLFDDIALLNIQNQKKIKNGYGVGLRVNSKIGTVGIDYGLSQITNILQGKIHLSFQNQF